MRYFAKINTAVLEDKMKNVSKLGFISLLCLVLVIGGVFATWNYAQGSVSSVSDTATIGLTGIGTDSEKATISIVQNGVSVQIDDDNNDYRGELVISGTIDIVVTIKAGADQDAYENGITVKIDLTEDFGDYAFAADASGAAGASKDVILLTSTSLTITKGTANGWVRTDDGGTVKFTYTLTTAKLNELITLAKTGDLVNVYLPTKANYDEFSAYLSGKTVTLTASEVM